MENISSACWLIKFVFDDEVPENLGEFFDEYFDVVAINYTDDGREEAVGYKSLDFDEKDMLSAAKNYGIILPEYKIEYLESKNWLSENVIKFAPFEIGNFCVFGSHEKIAPKSKKLPVMVYAATAFGSEHQTTKMCLEAISDIAGEKYDCKKILDVGTGSGILAIAAAKQWPEAKIMAVDIDAESVEVCKKNSADNQTEKNINCFLGDGYQLQEITNLAPYDLILTNIFARPLIAMSRDMAKNLKKGGFGIISGFIDEQLEWVTSEHEKAGLKIKKVYEMDNWRAVILEKI